MDCIIPCRRVQNTQWKPAIKQAQFPALLGLVLMAVGLGNSSFYVPVGRPAGIINKQGICYLASLVQVLDAVKFSLGEGSRAVFGADWGLIGGYNEIHDSGGDFRNIPSCIDPDKMVKEWVKLNQCLYKRPFIIKKIKQNDGSMTEDELFPEKVGDGAGGFVIDVFHQVVKELDEHCIDNNLMNPFTISLGDSRRKATQQVHKFMYEPCSDFPHDDEFSEYASEPQVKFSETSVVSNQLVAKAPRLLTLLPTKTQPHHLPLRVSFSDSRGKVGSYRLLAAAYGLPVIKEQEGFKGNHAIAVVRYGDTWYQCDNHLVTVFANEAEFIKWVDEAARTYYDGSGMKSGALRSTTPSMAIYELI